MRRCLQETGKLVEDDDLVYAWANYSDSVCASWLRLPDSDEVLLSTLLRYLPNVEKRWYTTMCDAEDGTGDGILPLPHELFEQLGWKEGDMLSITQTESGELILRRVK